MGCGLFVLGCIFFPCMNICFRNILKTFTGSVLSVTDQFVITEKVINSLQAIMSTTFGAIIVYNCQNNIMDDRLWLTNTYTWFGLPYFLYDLWAMYNSEYYTHQKLMDGLTFWGKVEYFSRSNIPMLFHHLVLPVIFFPVILYFRGNRGDYFVGIFFMCEAAIPFISIRFILVQLQLKHTKAYVFFGLLMIVMYFITRILLFPFLYWKYSKYSGIPFLHVPVSIPLHCNLGCLIILVVQLYFLALMIRGAFKAFHKMYKMNILKNG